MFKTMLNKKYREYHEEVHRVACALIEWIESKLKYQFLYEDFQLTVELTVDMSKKPFEISESLKDFEKRIVAKDIYDEMLKINSHLHIEVPKEGYLLTITRPALLQFLRNNEMLEAYDAFPLTDDQLNDHELVDLIIRAFEYLMKAATGGANQIFMPTSMDVHIVEFICHLAQLHYETTVIDGKDAYVISGWANLES